MLICISSWRDLEDNVRRTGASHVVSLLGLEGPAPTPMGIRPENHLNLEIDDIVDALPGYVPPEAAHMESLLAFAQAWNRERAMVVHCFAGISRSSAAALAIAALYNPGREDRAAILLRAKGPHLHPNRRIVALADRALALDGRLLSALDAIGPGNIRTFAPAVDIPLDLED